MQNDRPLNHCVPFFRRYTKRDSSSIPEALLVLLFILDILLFRMFFDIVFFLFLGLSTVYCYYIFSPVLEGSISWKILKFLVVPLSVVFNLLSLFSIPSWIYLE